VALYLIGLFELAMCDSLVGPTTTTGQIPGCELWHLGDVKKRKEKKKIMYATIQSHFALNNVDELSSS
jgi:hypothetical protein